VTPKQQLFAREYLVDLNGTQAAIRAGYAARGAEVTASRLLRNPKVATAIAEAQARRFDRLDMDADRVLLELARIASVDLGELVEWGTKEIAVGFDDEGRKLAPEDMNDAVVVHYVDAPFVKPVDSRKLTKHQRAAVSEVALTKDGFRIRTHGKTAALDLLARYHKLVGAKDEGGGAAVQVNVFVDTAPPETREQWLARVRRERLGLVAQADG
jgi:phage terminase small subunit